MSGRQSSIFFLKTDRIGFSRWKEGDINLAEQLWGNPDVTKYICASGVFTKAEILNRLNTEIRNGETFGVQYWPIFDRTTCELIGCCGLRPHGTNAYELGFHLLPRFWGQGYAVEAANAVIRYAFAVLKAKKLFAGHNPKNTASRKVLRKLKFTYIGDEFYEPTGLYHPSYELTQGITVRAATPEDAEQIGFVHREAWLETYTGLLPDSFLSKQSAEKSAAMFRTKQCGDMVVVDVCGKIAGFCGWGTFRDTCQKDDPGEIYGIYLLRDYQRLRLGQEMMTYAIAKLKAAGYQAVYLWVLKDNAAAIRFYEKQGFRYSGTHKKVDLGETTSELLYIKEICGNE